MPSPTVTVTASGRSTASPTLATVEAIAAGSGDTAGHARENAATLATSVRNALDDDTAETVRTVDVRIENTDELFDPTTDAAYEARRRLQIDCAPEAVESVVVAVTDAGGSVRAVEFRLDDEIRRQQQDEALANGTERARTKAERVADAEGMAVGEAISITAVTERTTTDSLIDDALGADAGTNLQSRTVTITEDVKAEYELVER